MTTKNTKIAQHLTDGEIEVKAATARVKRLTKKQAALQAQLNTLKALETATIAPLEAYVDEAKDALEAIKARQIAFEAKCAANKAARMAAASKK